MALRTLSKSRFKLAVECPTKVYYSLDKRYVDQRMEDDFLEALAKGGHQVGALAKLMYQAVDPAALEITVRDQAEQVRQTAELLKRDRVTIFEGTIQHENLLVRVDILAKRGNKVELIEVKAKSWDASEDSLLGNTPQSKPISPDWEPFVYDVAFQQYVMSKAYPTLKISPSLLLVDKSRRNSVPGLGTKFPVMEEGRDTTVRPAADFDVSVLKAPLLIQVDAAEAVRLAQTLVRERRGRPALEFEPLISQVAGAIAKEARVDPQPGNVCKKCEFYCEPEKRTEEMRSGWAECMETHFGKKADKPRSASIFGFYNQADLNSHIANRHLWMQELTVADLGVKEKPGEVSGTKRHELQWRELTKGDTEPFLQKSDIRAVMDRWVYPLHFIDFETATPALPFHAGHRPYQQILFQFSHHVVERDGSVRHANECLLTEGAEAPSIAVVRRLREAIGHDEGTVLHWYPHERTILRAVREELQDKNPADRDELIGFLDNLGLEKDSGLRMFDLGHLASRQVFLAGTGGSSSMKRFLPAVVRHSRVVRERYAKPVYGTQEIPSLNFTKQRWVVEMDGEALDPYRLLGPLFRKREIVEALAWIEESEGDVVANGAAAMIAYSQLQDPGIAPAEREDLSQQLKRYCELDTLAVVMVYEALREWVEPAR